MAEGQTKTPTETQDALSQPDPVGKHPALAEELPPDFWEREPLEPPPPTPADQAAPLGVRAHPLFAELQSLFPGRIVEELRPQSPGKQGDDDASDATEPNDAQAVDLEPTDDERDT